MEKTDRETMDEILAGYSGEKKAEETVKEIQDFAAFIKAVLEELLEVIKVIKNALGM